MIMEINFSPGEALINRLHLEKHVSFLHVTGWAITEGFKEKLGHRQQVSSRY